MNEEHDPTAHASRVSRDCPAGSETAVVDGEGGPAQPGEAVPREEAVSEDDLAARVLALLDERLPALEKKGRVERARHGRRSRVERG